MDTAIFAACRSKDMENSPPQYLHTRHLRADDQAGCEQNPTYSTSLASLYAFAKQVQEIRRQIAAEELGGMSEIDRRSLATVRSIDDVEKDKEKCRELELKLIQQDGELASLAEAILSKPKFSVVNDVKFINGRWYWPLPVGKFTLPRCTEIDLDYAFRVDQSKMETEPLVRKLSKKIPHLWRKSSADAKLVKRAISVDGAF